MKKSIFLASGLLLCVSCATKPQVETEPSLKDAFPDYKVGAAINVKQSSDLDSLGDSIIKQHFNSIVAENCMKCEKIHPEENRYFWDEADQFVKFGEENHMQIIGHCLIWHSQCAPWFGVDSLGKPVTPEVLKQRMKDHITTIMTRYKGRIAGWDVVNEAILDDGSYRPSFFYQILGEEYIPLAFQYAHEADPDAELYLNDYSMGMPGKCTTVQKIIADLKARGLRIDAVGLQSHMGMDYPNWNRFDSCVQCYVNAGVDVQFTEIDMSSTPTVTYSANVSDTAAWQAACNPYANGLPDSVATIWNERMSTFLSIVDKYVPHVRRVTAWGVTDADSWKNDWPIKGRTEYPLWFDRQGKMKPFLQERLKKIGE